MNFLFFGDKVLVAISRKRDGSMRLHGHPFIDEQAYIRRGIFFKTLGIEPEYVADSELIHGASAEVVGAPPFTPKMRIKDVDTLITDKKNVALAITNADCPTVYFYDPVGEVIALSHAGWKGILAGVIENAVEKLEKDFNTDPRNLEVFLGPGIRECHFEVGREVYDKFRPFGNEYVVQVPLKVNVDAAAADVTKDTHELKKIYRVDLFATIKERLVQAGVRREAIGDANQCTFCFKALTELKTLPEKSTFEYQYYSFRRDRSNPLETQVAVLMMR